MLLRLVVRVGTAVVLVVVVMVTVVVAIYVCKVTAPASMTQWPWQITTVGMCAPAAPGLRHNPIEVGGTVA